jgi:hypothetical protein
MTRRAAAEAAHKKAIADKKKYKSDYERLTREKSRAKS